MAVLPFQLALLGAVLLGPGAGSKVPRCALANAPGAVESKVVSSGDRLASLLRETGARPDEGARLRTALRGEHDLNNLAIGDRLDIVTKSDGAVLWFRYRRDTSQAICARRTLRNNFVVASSTLEATTALARIEVTIEHKLKDALLNAGEHASLGVMLDDLFISSLDRAADEAPAQLKLLVERRTVEGELLDYGRIFAAELSADGTTTQTFHFVSKTGATGYYDAQGQPRRSTKLRAPVPGATLTSGFGVRSHPIRRRRRMHKGIDYGAAFGTAVQAAAKGTVIFAQRKGHLGKAIGLRHEDGLVTHYAHLSGFATHTRAGATVHQGQVIGYVGSTGLSSGAHLHFETLVNKRHIDPIRLLSAPAPQLLPEDEEAFAEHMQELLHLLHPSDLNNHDA